MWHLLEAIRGLLRVVAGPTVVAAAFALRGIAAARTVQHCQLAAAKHFAQLAL
ncbi:hypothetical protein D3C83_173540 [compost metagenome]